MDIIKEKLDKIASFIAEESMRFKSITNDENIFVCMPYWLFTCFMFYHRKHVSRPEEARESDATFCGCKIQFHYKNEVIVFYKDYHKSPKLFEPKVYLIK